MSGMNMCIAYFLKFLIVVFLLSGCGTAEKTSNLGDGAGGKSLFSKWQGGVDNWTFDFSQSKVKSAPGEITGLFNGVCKLITVTIEGTEFAGTIEMTGESTLVQGPINGGPPQYNWVSCHPTKAYKFTKTAVALFLDGDKYQ